LRLITSSNFVGCSTGRSAGSPCTTGNQPRLVYDVMAVHCL
jgi:hypothetical protein